MTNETFDPQRRADGGSLPSQPLRTDRASSRAAESPAQAQAPEQAPSPSAAEAEQHPRVQLDEKLDGHQRQGVTGATWIALILGTVVLVLLLVFILQNNTDAQFAYFGWEFSLPLGIAMLFAAIAGVVITALLGSIRLFKLSRRVRALERERQNVKRALG